MSGHFAKVLFACQEGEKAFDNGVARNDCPSANGVCPTRPQDAGNNLIFGWLTGWDIACKSFAHKSWAHTIGCQAVILDAKCPYNKNENLSRYAYIKGFIDGANKGFIDGVNNHKNSSPEEH